MLRLAQTPNIIMDTRPRIYRERENHHHCHRPVSAGRIGRHHDITHWWEAELFPFSYSMKVVLFFHEHWPEFWTKSVWEEILLKFWSDWKRWSESIWYHNKRVSLQACIFYSWSLGLNIKDVAEGALQAQRKRRSFTCNNSCDYLHIIII